ncbi:MAG: DegT/DnrJ/EryC1/StrS family aminotransferase [Chitinispirillaceae bacterium]|jgi:dTDP-4-amino-4,6-dideoxygalactose transaminase|nr:DegT/DnrJ/EryC1/StrS family aminotransferase [Chitinispirillaceae bacterium]
MTTLTSTESIPFLNLSLPHLALEDELSAVFLSALRSGVFVGGPMVAEFESLFAQYCKTAHAVAVNSGTDALRFALMAAGIKKNDVVITVPNTFIATTEAISQAGAIPLFVDVDDEFRTMDPEALRSVLSRCCTFDVASGRTVLKYSGNPVTAIVPVHLYGQMADMDALGQIAENYSLTVIEDACQAHGASYYSLVKNCWMKAGSMGKSAAFSFYPGKNLGCLGEGGAVTTNDDRIARTIAMLRDHGQAKKYHHDFEGYNGRLDAIQAGMLSVKLAHLDKWNDLRRQHARTYTELLGERGVPVQTPIEPEWAKSIYHLYVIRTPERDALQAHLAERGIGTGLHYPVPLHLQKAYDGRQFATGDFPVTERHAREILSLPMFPEITDEQQVIVVDAIAEFFTAKALR